MTSKEILQKARSYIATIGWAQGTFASKLEWDRAATEDNITGVCAIGALRLASTGDAYDGSSHNAYYDARHALSEAVGDLSIPMWNDAPARTKREVLVAFDKAIASYLLNPCQWIVEDEPCGNPTYGAQVIRFAESDLDVCDEHANEAYHEGYHVDGLCND